MISFVERIRRAAREQELKRDDPLRVMVEPLVRGQEMIGTAPLLDLLGLPRTTGHARRLGRTMRSLGFVPVKSRRLLPGGYRDTVTRGWARPNRKINNQQEP